MTDTLIIPDDPQACRALIVELAQTVATLQQENVVLQQKNVALSQKEIELQLTIRELLQRAFQKRSERYLEDPNQLKIDFGATPEACAAAEGLADAIADNHAESGEPAEETVIGEHRRRKPLKRRTRQEQLPAHLPRYEVTLEAPADVRDCPAHGAKKLIGHDRLETLEYEPPKLRIRVTLIPKYVCEHQPACKVSEPARPEGLVEGNRYDTSVAAEIITAKYGFHLPIYRQQDLFAGSGWTPSRGTLLNILQAAGDLLPPFIDYLRKEVLASGVIGTDETRVTLLLPQGGFIPEAREDDPRSQRIQEVFAEARKAGKTSVGGRMWAYRSMLLPLSVFDFTVSRHRDGPDEFLVDSDFEGVLLGDCYAGYQGIALRSEARIARAACNAHARRKIFEAQSNHPLLASQALAIYRQLYDIEDRGKALSIEERHLLRQSEAAAAWSRLDELLGGEAAARLLPKDKLAEAFQYLRNHWDALRLYVSDGRLPIDNNEVEQLMKQVAVGRKNWLFIGSVSAGERAANFLTLVSSALRNDLDVFVYLKAVLDALLAGSTDDAGLYASLRPDRWAASHPESIRRYRQEERRERQEAKSTRRAARRKPPKIKR
jgi:transposase